MADIPLIETSRLRLRAHRPDDLGSCAAMWGDPAVTRYIGGRPFSREEVWARMLRYAGHWQWLGFGFWVIENRVTCKFIGEVGLAEFKRDVEPPLPPGPEAGWALSRSSHGNGYATEALQAVTAWHQKQIHAETISCIVHPENYSSVKVALKCGFKESGRALYKGAFTRVFVRPLPLAAQSLD